VCKAEERNLAEREECLKVEEHVSLWLGEYSMRLEGAKAAAKGDRAAIVEKARRKLMDVEEAAEKRPKVAMSALRMTSRAELEGFFVEQKRRLEELVD
jgi:hypothetical protein